MAWQWEKLQAEATTHQELVWKLNDKLQKLAHALKPLEALLGPTGLHLFINETSDADVTIGATINQGANDDKILTFKSSDIAHALASVAETDTYAGAKKTSATLGGLTIQALAEDAALTAALILESYGGTADTTKSTAGRALAEVYVAEHNGANALADVTADGNVWGVRCRRSSADVALALLDEDGDLWLGGGLTLGVGAVTSGTYTPTLTNVTNVAASTAYACQYMRVGAVVHVSGRVDVDPTLTATATRVDLSLPIASDFANSNECAGTAFCSAVAGMGAAIYGSVADNRAVLEFVSGDVANRDMHFTFTYRVI